MATNNTVLHLLEYNNYYNRIIKRENSLADYLIYSTDNSLVCNFNPADGLDTEHTFNVPYIANTPAADYVIAVDENNNIISRWFIVNAIRTRGGQYTLSLHRDLIADFYDEIINAPMFIERATANVGNPFIFNNEGMNFNQIKKKEVLLKDETKSGWYVGYVASNTDETTITVPTENGITYPISPIAYEDLPRGTVVKEPSSYAIKARGSIAGTAKYRQLSVNTAGLSLGSADYDYSGNNPYSSRYLFKNNRTAQQDSSAFLAGITSDLSSVHNSLLAELGAEINLSFIDKATADTLMSMNGQTYYDITAGKIFSVSISSTTEGFTNKQLTTGSGAYTILSGIAKERCEMELGGSGNVDVNLTFDSTYTKLLVSVIDLTITQGATLTIGANVSHLIDAPYKMFAIPAEQVSVVFSDNTVISSNPEVAKNLATYAATALGDNLYDIQYLPYCPFRTETDNEGRLVIGSNYNDAKDKTISVMTAEGNNISYMLWCKESNFSFNIQEKIIIPLNNIDFKIEHETSFCRIVSPNYNGSFEFKPTSNFGVDYFEVNCSYKPFQPYIHINPHFSTDGLYGGDFNDQRGLVCGGDFSLPIATHNWINYQIQNSAYRDSFNRQIENMETTFGYQIEQQRIAGRINAATAGLSGAAGGAMVGSVFGAGAGAAGAGIITGLGAAAASMYGLKKDLEFAQLQQEEALSYATDQFKYNLQNIRALPYTLGRIGAFTIDNKIFPFVEFFTATDEEKAALRQKLLYRGMTIGAIDTIKNYQQTERTFIQGSVIQLPAIVEDYHTSAAIANEIHKGVYI